MIARPLLRWLLFGMGLAVFLGVMLWLSLRTLAMEKQQERTAADAQVQERMRLALWRMDALASTLLIRENARPPQHYSAFHSPSELFAVSNAMIPQGEAFQPSPLLGNLPEFVRLHFEVMPETATLRSPQAPTGDQQALANQWYAVHEVTKTASKNLKALETLLARHPEVVPAQVRKEQPSVREVGAEKPAADRMKASAGTPAPSITKAVAAAPEADAKAETQTQAAPAVALQQMANAREFEQRSQVVRQQVLEEKQEALKAPLKKIAPVPVPAPNKTLGKPDAPTVADVAERYRGMANLPADKNTRSRSPAAPGAAPATASAPTGVQQAPVTGASRAAATDATAEAMRLAESPAAGASRSAAPAEGTGQVKPATAAQVGDLTPRWIENELFLVREVTGNGDKRLQGVWLDLEALRTRLLETVKDLLPQARLEAADPAESRADPATLATLPLKLAPGPVTIVQPLVPSALKPALIIAWSCAVAAALAIGLVLHRAMRLSERRGAFVSAVTHELRTPLTTFRLYSEMLADEMVPDPQQRRHYLQTLCDEATRLMHLVENVLAYSRIERGRTAARMELTRVGPLLERMEARLRQRCEQSGLELRLSCAPEVAEAQMEVDALAVEQILFNLTDNAAKYAAPDSAKNELHVVASLQAKRVEIQVRDFGPGLGREARRKLFQPFAKSATEAAHSAPGVGLGLALCRRLARELDGDLTMRPVEGPGACFVLTLPRV